MVYIHFQLVLADHLSEHGTIKKETSSDVRKVSTHICIWQHIIIVQGIQDCLMS